GRGAEVHYNDPFVPEIRPSRKYSRFAGRRSRPVANSGYDLYILCTSHSSYQEIDPAELEAPVLDTRGFFANNSGKVYKA
ncbi:MAG: nucleotide sugar dehydrogenase, partial [Desulfohalobiaceae bacterium]